MKIKFIFIWTIVLLCVSFTANAGSPKNKKSATIGVYYFDGWSGQNNRTRLGGVRADEPWAKDAPSHLTKRFVEEFSGREPVWGWRNDTQ